MLEAIDLSKVYDSGPAALDSLNLKIEPGEIFCLLGANGAGKTTTINLFLNFIEPSGGDRQGQRPGCDPGGIGDEEISGLHPRTGDALSQSDGSGKSGVF